MQLLNKLVSHFYIQERQMLGTLYRAGIERDMVYKAYYEKYNTRGQDRVPRWKELNKNIRDRIGWKTFAKIENIFNGKSPRPDDHDNQNDSSNP